MRKATQEIARLREELSSLTKENIQLKAGKVLRFLFCDLSVSTTSANTMHLIESCFLALIFCLVFGFQSRRYFVGMLK